MTDSKADAKSAAVAALCSAIVASVKEAGALGAPGGPIYAALMTYGCSLEQFESIMAALVKVGKLEKRGQLYFVKEEKHA